MNPRIWAATIITLGAVCLSVAAANSPEKQASREAPAETNSTDSAKPSSTGRPKGDKIANATLPDASSAPVMITNTVAIAGRRVTYTAETGMMPLLKKDGEWRASVFYTAYLKAKETDKASRPVVFCFNGGPGSSSVWLHLGGLGPRRVKMNDDGTMTPPPFRLTDNEFSILHVADLVFVDPVATGYSRPAKDEKPDQFFGQTGDIESVGDFIRLWTTRQQRWLSPKYLCGESYGAFRAAGLAEHLHSRYGMYLNGVVLLSGVLDFATLREGPGNDLPSIIFLPAYTAAAHFHGKLPADLQSDLPKALAEARSFARGDYALGLLKGAALTDPERAALVARLARLTGLPAQVIEDNDLQVDSARFRELLLRDEGLIIGRFDARITGRDADKSSPAPRFDPSFAAALGPFAAAMNAYLRQELKYDNDLPYEVLTSVSPWNYEARNSYPSMADRLASVMSQNPHLRVLVLGGLRDLACPIDSVRYSIDHMRLDPALRANITCAEYDSGHMMYVNLPDLEKMQRDLEAFVKP